MVRGNLLRALCDTLVPRVTDVGPEATMLMTAASDIGVDEMLAAALPTMAPHVRTAVSATLAALSDDFPVLAEAERRQRWLEVREDRATYAGAIILQTTVLGMCYTTPTAAWPAIGYPGPLREPPTAAEFPKTLTVFDDPADTITADAVIIGSGAGGGVAAARLAAAGLAVVVLEKGAYRNEPDFPQLEALSLANLYLGGDFLWSTTGSAALLAGSTVGGGTTVNSMACLPPPDEVLEEWARHGMDTDTFADHVASVRLRINATTSNTVHNGVNRTLARAFERRGIRYEVLARNARDNSSRYCGECNAGCLTGCKQSTMNTYLQDASDDGAVLVPGCEALEILHRNGVATGVRARAGERDITVNAPIVVLAAGALVTPLLLRDSGLGGPAVGDNLHVHPSYFMSGLFDEVVDGWAGQILTCASQEFDRFTVEAAPMSLGCWGAFTPWHDGERHKRDLLRLRHVSGVWGFVRDHGAGSVRRGADGLPLVTWELDDPVDRSVVRRCHVELARLLHAAGAREIFTFLPADPRWREGEDFDAFLDRLATLAPPDIHTFSAHQSGTCATGTVVDGHGRVRGVSGVYIVDASALPTAPGVNPMISIEAFASKTATHIVEDWEHTCARHSCSSPASGSTAPTSRPARR